MELKGKKALVCGSTQGIGWSTAQIFAKRGAEVVLVARNEEKLIACVNELNAISSSIHGYIVADFSNIEQFQSQVHNQVKDCGFDILVNNTGALGWWTNNRCSAKCIHGHLSTTFNLQSYFGSGGRSFNERKWRWMYCQCDFNLSKTTFK